MLEFGAADNGWKAVGMGHVHRNVTGQPFRHSPSFSEDDESEARKGRYIFMQVESDPKHIYLLNPDPDRRRPLTFTTFEFRPPEGPPAHGPATEGQWWIVR